MTILIEHLSFNPTGPFDTVGSSGRRIGSIMFGTFALDLRRLTDDIAFQCSFPKAIAARIGKNQDKITINIHPPTGEHINTCSTIVVSQGRTTIGHIDADGRFHVHVKELFPPKKILGLNAADLTLLSHNGSTLRDRATKTAEQTPPPPPSA
jgi:hypothetical protein